MLPGRSDHLFAQSPDTVTSALPYHCWFDEDHSTMLSGNIGNGIISLDVSPLNEGVHSVNVQVGDGIHAQLWRQIFYKLPDSPDSTYHVSTYHCWFDYGGKYSTNCQILPTLPTTYLLTTAGSTKTTAP